MLSVILAFTALTWKIYAASQFVSGSGYGVDPIDICFCIELIGLGPTQFTIYWMRPDTTSYVSYYQVSYNVTTRYQTTAGQRISNDNNATNLSNIHHYLDIPLYANSTYSIQVVAVTDDGEIINSDVLTIPEDMLKREEQNDSVKFFQLGFNAQATIDCQSFEGDYETILLLIQSQVIQAVQDICTVIRNDSETCTTQFADERFSCHNNSRLVYIARAVDTMHTNAATVLEFLGMLGSLEISLNNRTFSIISSPLCPLSIPSVEDLNCTVGLTTKNITGTATTTEVSNDIVMVTVVALSCFVGIILMTLCIAGIMFVCSRCNSYQGDIESIDLDGEETCKEKNDLPSSSRQSTQDNTLNIPLPELSIPQHNCVVPSTQQLNFSGTHMNSLPSSHNNSHHGNHNINLHTTSL